MTVVTLTTTPGRSGFGFEIIGNCTGTANGDLVRADLHLPGDPNAILVTGTIILDFGFSAWAIILGTAAVAGNLSPFQNFGGQDGADPGGAVSMTVRHLRAGVAIGTTGEVTGFTFDPFSQAWQMTVYLLSLATTTFHDPVLDLVYQAVTTPLPSLP